MSAATVNTILVVEDDEANRILLNETLGKEGYEVMLAEDVSAGMEALKRQGFNVVLTDLRLPDGSGLDILAYVNEQMPSTPVIVMSGYGSINLAVEAMRKGAYDFQEKPLNTEHLCMTLERALRKTVLRYAFDYLRREQPYIYQYKDVVAESAQMKQLLKQTAKLASSDITVLLTGETGTGKSLIAGSIHANSPRSNNTIITVNCAALPETLLESELFGHEKGAFTGADRNRVGRIQQAHGGTLFLDEVGDMSLAIQAKLLRALEDKIIQPLGSTRSIKVDVRVLSATNVNLIKAVDEGRFREDLYYRLSVTSLDVPPLRERREDILPLTHRFIHQICADSKRPLKEMTNRASQKLVSYDWPGNVRELRNAVERAILLSEGASIDVEDFNIEKYSTKQSPASPVQLDTFDLNQVECNTIMAALERSEWVQARAADLLGITPRTLHYKIQKLGLSHPQLDARRRR